MPIELERLTGMPHTQREKVLHWMARQPEATKATIMKERHRIFLTLKNKHQGPIPVLDLAALYLACGSCGFYADKQYRSGSLTKDDIKSITNRRILKARELTTKIPNISGRLDRLWGEVVDLRREKFSFDKISIYFLKQHKFDVSASTIRKFWNKWERYGKLPLD